MKTNTIILILSFISFNSCNERIEKTDFDRDVINEEVSKMFDDYYSDIKNHGVTAGFKYLDNSKDFFWVIPNNDKPLSYEAIVAILKSNAKASKSEVLNWETFQATPLSNTIASFTGIVRSVSIDTSDIQTISRIIESGTVIKRGNDWKILNGQSAILKE